MIIEIAYMIGDDKVSVNMFNRKTNIAIKILLVSYTL